MFLYFFPRMLSRVLCLFSLIISCMFSQLNHFMHWIMDYHKRWWSRLPRVINILNKCKKQTGTIEGASGNSFNQLNSISTMKAGSHGSSTLSVYSSHRILWQTGIHSSLNVIFCWGVPKNVNIYGSTVRSRWHCDLVIVNMSHYSKITWVCGLEAYRFAWVYRMTWA